MLRFSYLYWGGKLELHLQLLKLLFPHGSFSLESPSFFFCDLNSSYWLKISPKLFSEETEEMCLISMLNCYGVEFNTHLYTYSVYVSIHCPKVILGLSMVTLSLTYSTLILGPFLLFPYYNQTIMDIVGIVNSYQEVHLECERWNSLPWTRHLAFSSIIWWGWDEWIKLHVELRFPVC